MNDIVKMKNREKAKRWREKNLEKCKESKKKSWYKYHDKNLIKSKEKYQADKIKRQSYARKKYPKNKARLSNTRLKRLFGISQNDYDELFKKQNGVCAICNLPETMMDNKQFDIRKLAVDHCHKTNKIRGLLCFNCNIGLGKFKDSIEMLQKALNYLNQC